MRVRELAVLTPHPPATCKCPCPLPPLHQDEKGRWNAMLAFHVGVQARVSSQQLGRARGTKRTQPTWGRKGSRGPRSCSRPLGEPHRQHAQKSHTCHRPNLDHAEVASKARCVVRGDTMAGHLQGCGSKGGSGGARGGDAAPWPELAGRTHFPLPSPSLLSSLTLVPTPHIPRPAPLTHAYAPLGRPPHAGPGRT
jgi:hypothetical protein